MEKFAAAKAEPYDNHSIQEPTFFKLNEFTAAF